MITTQRAREQLSRDKIAAILRSLSDDFDAENESAYGEIADQLVETYHGIPRADVFDRWVRQHNVSKHDALEVAHALARRMGFTKHADKITVLHLYTRYAEYDRMLDHMFEEFEGVACSSDKAHTLLTQIYPVFLRGEDVTRLDRNRYTPNGTTYTAWCQFIVSLTEFSDGKFDAFFAAQQELQQRYAEMNAHRTD